LLDTARELRDGCTFVEPTATAEADSDAENGDAEDTA
jgi:hypothetical protein